MTRAPFIKTVNETRVAHLICTCVQDLPIGEDLAPRTRVNGRLMCTSCQRPIFSADVDDSYSRITRHATDTQREDEETRVTCKTHDRIIRPAELVQWLGISRATLWRMQRRGELPPPLRISARAVGWRESTILKFLDDREAEAALNKQTDKES